MTRDELLTQLAMELPEWPRYLQGKTYEAKVQEGWVLMSEVAWQQRRTELINEPDDADAPEWARWKVQGANGTWYWCESKPTMSELGIVAAGRVKTSKGCAPAVHDWQKTLKPVNQDTSQNEPVMSRNERQLNPPTSSLTDETPCSECPNQPDNFEAEFDAKMLDQQLKEAMDATNPKHYRKGDVECIDALKAATVGKTGIEAVCVANVIKYLWRYEEKNGVEDVEKALWYLNRLHDELHD